MEPLRIVRVLPFDAGRDYSVIFDPGRYRVRLQLSRPLDGFEQPLVADVFGAGVRVDGSVLRVDDTTIEIIRDQAQALAAQARLLEERGRAARDEDRERRAKRAQAVQTFTARHQEIADSITFD